MSSHTSLITSASKGVAQVRPIAPRSSCSLAMRGDLWAERKTVRGCVRRRAVEICGEAVEIDDGNRRLEIGQRERHGDAMTFNSWRR
jgi:hypothetical protein